MNRKKLIFVNNNMNIGGVQKSLCNLLKEISDDYDVTLLLFSPTGEYMKQIPESVTVKKCSGAYRYLGISQKECKTTADYFIRGMFAFLTKLFGIIAVLRIMNLFQKEILEEYDCAISFLHDGNKNSFYGGCNEFTLSKINAKQKIAFLHCDYEGCGANYKVNNEKYKKFDKIAACSDGCKKSFVRCVDVGSEKIFTVINCHDFKKIIELSDTDTVNFEADTVNVISVARLSSEKGLDRGIKAIHYATEKGVNAKYHIVGDGIKRAELRALCDEMNISERVVFYGNQDNPYRYIKNADLLLIPSYHEAAPLVIGESRCLGVPILSTKTTSSHEMIINTNSGWVCENDQDGLNEKLFEIISKTDVLKHKKQEMQSVEIDNRDALQNFHSLLNN